MNSNRNAAASNVDQFFSDHDKLTRRYFCRMGVVGLGLSVLPIDGSAAEEKKKSSPVAKAGAQPNPYFTPTNDFQDVSRGKPLPHSLPEEKKREVGLTRETWRLDVLSDPEHPATLGKTFTHADDTAIDFNRLMQLAEKHVVRFPKVMTCLNLGCPLGMGLWEGVPLRELLWLTKPKADLRRVFYYGYHNDDPQQIFRSSLPVGRVLEDPFDLPPVILCYKLNGQWLDSVRGGPVRMVVPEAYGFKSVKWLTHVVLTNLANANDTYQEQNNDIDSPLKTFSATLSYPDKIKSGIMIPVSGYAQVGLSGLSKVQVSLQPKEKAESSDEPFFEDAALVDAKWVDAKWVDAELLQRPADWSGLEDGKMPGNVHGFDTNGEPLSWPMRFTKAHWAIVLPGQAAGEYVLRSRSIDDKRQAQPLPRPFRKSGHAAIESITIRVED